MQIWFERNFVSEGDCDYALITAHATTRDDAFRMGGYITFDPSSDDYRWWIHVPGDNNWNLKAQKTLAEAIRVLEGTLTFAAERQAEARKTVKAEFGEAKQLGEVDLPGQVKSWISID